MIEIDTDFERALVGRRVRYLAVEPGEESMAIVCDEGAVGLATIADCCSETWFADFIGVDALIGQRIVSVAHEYSGPDGYDEETDGRTRQQYDAAYGLVIKTDAGTTNIVYRNSSNGYYGGSARVMSSPPCLDGWRRVTEDWSA